MRSNLVLDKEYKAWLTDIKARIRSAQLKAAVKVNSEMLLFYWELGADIVAKQASTKWGEKFLDRLSKDLMSGFPNMKGFSKRNLELIRQWYLFYNNARLIVQQAVGQLGQQPAALIAKQAVSQSAGNLISQQAVGQITQIPWGHNIVIVTKCKGIQEALFYVQNVLRYNWSRDVLVHQIESGFYEREGKAVTNFEHALPKPQSGLAQQTLKNPYIFDFLSMSTDHNERDLENKLIENLTSFLLELGAGFAFVGKQVPIRVGKREFFIDLLFYHTQLHCHIVAELKTGDFEPEHAGKLNFYIKAVDSQWRKDGDGPTIGLLLCKKREKLVAEYALSDIHKPIGVSEYKLTHSLPKELTASLPTIEAIEKELSKGVVKRR